MTEYNIIKLWQNTLLLWQNINNYTTYIVVLNFFLFYMINTVFKFIKRARVYSNAHRLRLYQIINMNHGNKSHLGCICHLEINLYKLYWQKSIYILLMYTFYVLNKYKVGFISPKQSIISRISDLILGVVDILIQNISKRIAIWW